MTEDELQRIEIAIGRPLPEAFRRAMLNFPQELINAAQLTDDMGNEWTDSMIITPNADYIIDRFENFDPDWPPHFITVGDNGCGEEYSVDISQELCPVYESGPHNDAGANGPAEEGYFEQVSPDLEGLIAHLVKQLP